MKNFQFKLNSYKADTAPIQKQLSQLKQLKSQLQTTISTQQSQNYQLKIQIQRLKHENQMLRMKIQHLNNERGNKTSILKQQKKIIELQEVIQKLQKNLQYTLTSAKKNLEMYNQQLQQNKKIRQSYQEQELWLKEQLQNLRLENQHLKGLENQFKIKQVFKLEKKEMPSHVTNKTNNASQPPQLSTYRALNKSKLGDGVSKCKTSPFSDDFTVQQIYMKLMRKLYSKIKQKGLSVKQISILPQVKTLKNLNTVSQSNLAKLLGSYPFQIKDSDEIHRSYKSMCDQLIKKYKDLSGTNFFDLLYKNLSQCQLADLLSSQIQISKIVQNQVHYNYPQKTERTQRTSPAQANQPDNSVCLKRKNSYHSQLNMQSKAEKQNINPKMGHFEQLNTSRNSRQKSQSSLKSVSQVKRSSERSGSSLNEQNQRSQQSQESSGYGGNFFTVQNYADPINQSAYQKKYNGPDKRFSGPQKYPPQKKY